MAKIKKFKPLISQARKKAEESKTKRVPPNLKHMAEDDQESHMTINNKKVHFVTLGGYNKSDPKSFANRLSSSDDDYDYYQIYDDIPKKKFIEGNGGLNFIDEEDQNR